MPENNETIIRRFMDDVWNKRNLDLCDQLVAPNWRNHDPNTPDFGVGPEACRKFVNMYSKAFPDEHFTVEDIVTQGDMGAFRWTVTGTHKGELRGIKPTGKKVTVSGIGFCRFSNGKMTDHWAAWDALGLMQQLGALPKEYKAA